jgi:Acyl-CoA dehydrogenase, C-terminal domain
MVAWTPCRCLLRIHAHGLITKISRMRRPAIYQLRPSSDGHFAVPARAPFPQCLLWRRALIIFEKSKELTEEESILAAFDAALACSKERVAFGKPIFEHKALQLRLADMATRLEVARQLLHRCTTQHA